MYVFPAVDVHLRSAVPSENLMEQIKHSLLACIYQNLLIARLPKVILFEEFVGPASVLHDHVVESYVYFQVEVLRGQQDLFSVDDRRLSR